MRESHPFILNFTETDRSRILLLPFAIATALICIRPDAVPNRQSYGTIMHTLIDDARILVESKTEKDEQETPRRFV